MAKIKFQVDADMGSAPGSFDKMNEQLQKMGIQITGIGGKAHAAKKELSGWDGILKNFGFDVAKLATGFGAAELAVEGMKKAVGFLVTEYKELLRIQGAMADKTLQYSEIAARTYGPDSALQKGAEEIARRLKIDDEKMAGIIGVYRRANPAASNADILSTAEMVAKTVGAVGAGNLGSEASLVGSIKKYFPTVTNNEAGDAVMAAFEKQGRTFEGDEELSKFIGQGKEAGLSFDQTMRLFMASQVGGQGARGMRSLMTKLAKGQKEKGTQFDDAYGSEVVAPAGGTANIPGVSGEERLAWMLAHIDDPAAGFTPAEKVTLRQMKNGSAGIAGAFNRQVGTPLSASQMLTRATVSGESLRDEILMGDTMAAESGLLRKKRSEGLENIQIPWIEKQINTGLLKIGGFQGTNKYEQMLTSISALQETQFGRSRYSTREADPTWQKLEELKQVLTAVHASMEKMRQENRQYDDRFYNAMMQNKAARAITAFNDPLHILD